MKNATLWRRILNEGVRPSFPRGSSLNDVLQAEIITSTILLCPPTPVVESSWIDLSGISIPFQKFWIEGSVADDPSHLWGCLFESKTTESGFDIRAVCCNAKDFSPEKTSDIGFCLDPKGTPVPDTFECELPEGIAKFAGSVSAAKAAVSYPALAACMALMVLGCKNVSLESRDNNPKEVRRAVNRHGGNADSYRYHVLVVRPPGAKAGTKGQEVGIMPHHVCRGHFSEYGPEFNKGLLFGKYAGRFYVPPCVKGKKERGTVVKDYAIAPGSDNEGAGKEQ